MNLVSCNKNSNIIHKLNNKNHMNETKIHFYTNNNLPPNQQYQLVIEKNTKIKNRLLKNI